MRKRGFAAAVLLVLLLLSGCKRSNIATNIGPVLDEWRIDHNDPGHEARPLEILTYGDADFSDSLGFKMTGLPNDRTLWPTHYFVLDGWYAQIQFDTADGRSLVLRVAPEDGMYLSGTYLEAHLASDETTQVDGIEVRTRTAGNGCAMLTWTRDGYQFLLHSNKVQGMPPDEDIEKVVAEARAAATAAASSSAVSGPA